MTATRTLTRLQRACLAAMDIPVWQARAVPGQHNSLPESVADSEPDAVTPTTQAASEIAVSASRKPDFASHLLVCKLAPFSASPGLLVISDLAATTANSSPFSEAAGRMFTAMLDAIDYPMEQCAITQVASAGTTSDAVALASIETARAVLYFTEPGASHALPDLEVIREKPCQLPDQTPVIVTYHPDYLLTTPALKRATWTDLKRLRGYL